VQVSKKALTFWQSSFAALVHPCHSATHRSALGAVNDALALVVVEQQAEQPVAALEPVGQVELEPAEPPVAAVVRAPAVVVEWRPVAEPGLAVVVVVVVVEAAVGTLGTVVAVAVSSPQYLQEVGRQLQQVA
jgi:hypothetical protein